MIDCILQRWPHAHRTAHNDWRNDLGERSTCKRLASRATTEKPLPFIPRLGADVSGTQPCCFHQAQVSCKCRHLT